MLIPNAQDVEDLASTLYITVQRPAGEKEDFTTTPTAKWELNQEQRRILRLVLAHRRVIFLKSRQVGSSTINCLILLMFALCNDDVPVCLVADTADKARGLLQKITDWCDQLGVEYTGNKSRIRLSNGAEIDALSAVSRAEGGESRVGRSRSYGMIVVSELAFIINDKAVFRGLTSTALPGARLIVESTASSADPNLFKTLWLEDEEDDWERCFLSLEEHEAYRADPDSISDEKWAELQESRFGFTIREAAAWWWQKCRTDFAGDIIGCLREYCILPRHCFQTAEGKYINKYTEADIVSSAAMVNGRPVGWTEYAVDNIGEDLIMGVDVAAGLGGDASAIAIMGAGSRKLYATWMDHWTSQPDLIELVKATHTRWAPKKIIVESNHVGMPVYLALKQHTRLPIVEQHSSHEKHLRMSLLKMYIEDGTIRIGPELIFEAGNSRIAKPSGPKGAPDYQGKDDCLNAVSFANKWIENHAPKATPVDLIKKLDPRLVFHRSFLAKKRKECF